jgi:putative membrane protein
MFRPILITIATAVLLCALGACRSDHDRRFGDTRGGLNSEVAKPQELDDPESRIPDAHDPESERQIAQAHATEASTTRHEPAARVLDREFVDAASVGGVFEVRAARLALERDVSPAVRQFAQRVVDEYEPANAELALLALTAGIRAPGDLDAEHQTQLDELARAQGPAFEGAYRAGEIAAHDAAIARFQRAAAECEDAGLRAFAERTLPVLRKHRELLDHTRP